jgi:hypothetical protein
LTKSTSTSEASEKIRPGAGGHRFGPDLQCGECGRNWDEHQRDPRPCADDPVDDGVVVAALPVESAALGIPQGGAAEARAASGGDAQKPKDCEEHEGPVDNDARSLLAIDNLEEPQERD